MTQWIWLFSIMAVYPLWTWLGWHHNQWLTQHPQWKHYVLLFTCGVWLELIFMDLLPSNQSTLLGTWGYYHGHLLGFCLFFTPLFVLSLIQTWQDRQHTINKVQLVLRYIFFCCQNILEGILIYFLYRANPIVCCCYLLFSAPHALSEAISLRFLLPEAKSHAWWGLAIANYFGLAVGWWLNSFTQSLIGITLTQQFLAGYLTYICIVELYQTIILEQHKRHVPYALFLGMLVMSLLNLLV